MHLQPISKLTPMPTISPLSPPENNELMSNWHAKLRSTRD
ncbi:hypothetical protein PTUN_b0742 [Pseudoalteromonas tunicata]|nr:hypothetical protein PTUN_b0742 [Pseudoalteromonas tunicata]